MTIAEDLVDAHAPWTTPDLEDYLEAVGGMFAEFEALAANGWADLLDPDLCPAAALPYLAQYVGERLPQGLDEAAQREWIKDAPNQRRGTTSSIVRVARRWLTGSQAVAIRERNGDEDHIAIRTLVPETVDAARLRADLLRDALPSDIVVDYQAFTGTTLGDIAAAYATLGAISAANPTLGDIAFNLVGYTVYTA